MEVTYTLTVADVVHFQKYLLRRSSPRNALRTWAVAFFLLLISGFLLMISTDKVSTLISSVVPLALIFVFWKVFLRFALARQAKNTPALGDVQVLRITPQHFVQTTPTSETKMLWQGIFDVAQDANYLYLLLNKQRGYLVPKRAFLDAVQAQTFYETAAACWKSAKAGSLAPNLVDNSAWPPPPQRPV